MGEAGEWGSVPAGQIRQRDKDAPDGSSEPCALERRLQPPRTSRTGCTPKSRCRGWFADCRLNKPEFGAGDKHETGTGLFVTATQRSRRIAIATRLSRDTPLREPIDGDYVLLRNAFRCFVQGLCFAP